ncbi:MAG: hypothetical protein Q9192_008623, partial [Flavoplaca navasiana]
VSAIKTYITDIVEVLMSQHAVVSILVETLPATEVNGKGNGNGNGGEGVNSTSSFIASYTEPSIAGGNATGGVITTYFGTYIDSWVREKNDWKIKARTVTIRVGAFLFISSNLKPNA